MHKKYEAHIISHSHWDREWYLPLEEYRVWLVDMIDRLLDVLQADDDYHAFMLDGHTALVEDYLAVKPENEERLAGYIRAGRILVGPWYVLPDQMLVSGEAHIRNYLLGQRLCRRLGGNMQLGYAPDAFGHPAQLPQVYKKLGLGEILFWRGLGDGLGSNEFVWQGPDGSEILGLNLAYGYGNCPNLPAQPGAFLDRIDYVVRHYAPLSATGVMLVMNGRDHLEAQPHIPAMARQASAMSEDTEIVHSDLPAYVAALRSQLDVAAIPRHQGALYSAGRVALLEGTLSTRMYLKQENQHVEDLLERWAEPFCSLAQIAGGESYPVELLRHAWRFLLQNHPHDSITGCSVDEVHREMMVRFASAGQTGQRLLNRAFGQLAGVGAEESEDVYITVYNPSPYVRSEEVQGKAEMFLRLSNALIYEHMRREQFEDGEAGRPLPTSLELEDEHGVRVTAHLEKACVEKVMRYYTYTQPHEFYAHCCYFRFVAEDVPPLGYKNYRVVPGYGPAAPAAPQGPGAVQENRHFRLWAENARLYLLDKRSGRQYSDIGALWDDGDAGDEYLYHAALGPALRLEEAEVQATGSGLFVKGVLRLPEGLLDDAATRSETLVDCPVEMEVRLHETEPRVDFFTSFTNRAQNHRLRAVFPAGVQADCFVCDNTFGADCHRLPPAPGQTAARSQKRFTSVSDGQFGAAVANRGLPEVEVRQEGEETKIFLTLLRCVGIMANGPTGLNIPTPEGQCLGRHHFAYSFFPHKGGWQQGKVPRLAENFCLPLAVRQMEDGKKPARGSYSGIAIEAPELVLSAFKQAENLKHTFILRLYNPGGGAVKSRVQLGFACKTAHLCNLREEKETDIPLQENSLQLELGPYEILTLALNTGV